MRREEGQVRLWIIQQGMGLNGLGGGGRNGDLRDELPDF